MVFLRYKIIYGPETGSLPVLFGFDILSQFTHEIKFISHTSPISTLSLLYFSTPPFSIAGMIKNTFFFKENSLKLHACPFRVPGTFPDSSVRIIRAHRSIHQPLYRRTGNPGRKPSLRLSSRTKKAADSRIILWNPPPCLFILSSDSAQYNTDRSFHNDRPSSGSLRGFCQAAESQAFHTERALFCLSQPPH